MLSFYIFLAVLFIGAYAIKQSRYDDKYIYIYAWIVIVFFFGGINGAVQGGDITNYYNHVLKAKMYDNYRDYLDVCPFDTGYAILTWIVAHIFRNPQVFLYIQYGFVMGVFLYFIYKNTRDPMISLVFFISVGGFTFYLTAFRQAIACAICLIAAMRLKKKKIVSAIFLILLARLFHKTAIIFLPILLVYRLKVSKKSIALFSAGSVVVTLFLERIVRFANDALDMDYHIPAVATLGIIINVSYFSALFILLWIKSRKEKEKFSDLIAERRLELIVFMSLTYAVVYLMRFYSQALERVSFYYILATCPLWSFALPQKGETRFGSQYRTVFCLLAILLVAFRFRHTFGSLHLIYW